MSNFKDLSIIFIFCGLSSVLFCAAVPSACPYQKKNILSAAQQNVGDQCHPKQLKCDPNNVYYTIDGSCNNMDFPTWAQTGTPYTRFVPAHYADGFCSLRLSSNGTALPLARKIRTEVITSLYIPSGKYNILFYGFGQWVDHDVTKMAPVQTQQSCCTENNQPAAVQPPDICLPIIIPQNDPFYSQFHVTCLDVKRAVNTHLQGCDNVKPCSPINHQTGVFDLSIMYGPEARTASELRSFKGGLLKIENNAQTNYEPFPPITSGMENCPAGGITPEPGSSCTQSGDDRVDQNPEIFVIEVILVRVHNYIAATLKQINPDWNDEQLFQETRRITIALYQHVVFSQHVPLLIGYYTSSRYKLLPSTNGYSNDYDRAVNPQTIAEYSFAAGRTSHSTIKGRIDYLDSNGRPTSYLLRNKYFNMQFQLEKNVFLNIVQSFSTTQCSRQDIWGDEEINDWLFHTAGEKFGLDLASIDINRGRDAGIPTYNSMRQACGLCKLNNFAEFVSEVMEPEDVPKLEALYNGCIDDLDVYTAGLLEKPVAGSMFGPTLSCIMGEAFFRWKVGDRLYYEFPSAGFTLPQLNTIREATFAWFVCKGNPTLTYVPKNAFLVQSTDNPLIRCDQVPSINFQLWKA